MDHRAIRGHAKGLTAALAAIALCLPAPVLAWGGYGHRTTAEIAEANVSPQTRAAMNRLFAYEDHMSVTISAADEWMHHDREDLARKVWAEVSKVTGLNANLPEWQINRERRATFAAIPSEAKKRPGPKTQYDNLFLAGDWTATGLPACMEGAVRSGNAAARPAASRAARSRQATRRNGGSRRGPPPVVRAPGDTALPLDNAP